MQDGYGRQIEYLRLSITDRCNLRCRYCMPSGIEKIPMSKILSYEDFTSICEAAAGLGISRIRITGGEPLVRKNVSSLISMLKNINGIEQIALTTNGILLNEQLDELLAAGLDRINISLDTLDPLKYRQITGFDGFETVLKGLDAVIDRGIPVKLNAVSIDWNSYLGISDTGETKAIPDDIINLIELAREKPVDVRFIEIMPIGFGKGFSGISHDILIPGICRIYEGMERENIVLGNGPAVYYRIPGFKGRVGFISAIHEKFCDSCNRIRLTSTGFLKSCLCYDTGVDLKEALGSGKDALQQKISECIRLKPDSHSFTENDRISEKQAMSSIGG